MNINNNRSSILDDFSGNTTDYSSGDFFNFFVLSGKLYKIINSNVVDMSSGEKLKCLNAIVRTRYTKASKNDMFVKISVFGDNAYLIEKKFAFDKDIIINGYFKSALPNKMRDGKESNSSILEFVVRQIIKFTE